MLDFISVCIRKVKRDLLFNSRSSCALLVLFIGSMSIDSFAQDESAAPAASAPASPSTPGSSKKAPKRTTINFEDQLIEGRTQKPELFVLLQNRMNNSRRLFKLRENFLPEMRKTAEDVGKNESGGAGKPESAK